MSIIYTQLNRYRVVLEADPRFQEEAASPDKIHVKGTGGRQVPLSALAHYELANTTLSVNHQGQFPATSLTFNLDPGTSLGEATAIIQKAASALHMPGSSIGSFQGTAKVFQNSPANQKWLVIAAILAVYIVLGSTRSQSSPCRPRPVRVPCWRCC